MPKPCINGGGSAQIPLRPVIKALVSSHLKNPSPALWYLLRVFQRDAEFACELHLEDKQQPSLSYTVISQNKNILRILLEREKHLQVRCVIAAIAALTVTL